MKTEMIFILDRSGSMRHLEEDTIGSFNSLIDKQKQEEGQAFITTVLFNNETKLIHLHQDIHEVNELTKKDYYASGSTSLLDAVGETVREIRFHYNDQLREERPDKVIFVIITDGMENSSTTFTASEVRKMIETSKQKYDWEFLFIGANLDAVKEGARLGITPDRAVNYHADRKGSKVVYNSVNEAMSNVRKGKKLDKKWMNDINKDFQERS